jgi:hypothetical protein
MSQVTADPKVVTFYNDARMHPGSDAFMTYDRGEWADVPARILVRHEPVPVGS